MSSEKDPSEIEQIKAETKKILAEAEKIKHESSNAEYISRPSAIPYFN